ncbi:unnamed protein product [Zymoseptoria tritici ST99CH_3D1]|nr:unnamed protein product [Zymoseptoria tritici ST99CH_3D1]
MKNLFAILAMAAVGPAIVSAQSYDNCACTIDGTSANLQTGVACSHWKGQTLRVGGNGPNKDDLYCYDPTCVDKPTFARYCTANGADGDPNCSGSSCYN